MTRGLKLLGLCSWGYTKHFEGLINPDPSDFHHAKYNSWVDATISGDNVPLNGDHTHFLLIDDGSRYAKPIVLNNFSFRLFLCTSDTDETLVSSRVSRDSRVSVSVSDSYNAFLQSRSQSQSRIRSFTFDDVTGRESLFSKVSVSVSSLEIF